MLFIDPLYINQGIGTFVIKKLTSSKGILSVDVNEQNESAKKMLL
ncbi:Acetyltransferase (fragment) [Pseudolactococcus piscium]